MIVSSGKVDKALGAHLHKVYKTQAPGAAEQGGAQDVVTISKFAELVERGRAAAMSLPDVRADRVEQARRTLDAGDLPGASSVAAAMINGAVEGQVAALRAQDHLVASDLAGFDHASERETDHALAALGAIVGGGVDEIGAELEGGDQGGAVGGVGLVVGIAEIGAEPERGDGQIAGAGTEMGGR